MQAEYLNSHSSIHSNTVTAILPISNARVEKKPQFWKTQEFQVNKRFKGILILIFPSLLYKFSVKETERIKTILWIYKKYI